MSVKLIKPAASTGREFPDQVRVQVVFHDWRVVEQRERVEFVPDAGPARPAGSWLDLLLWPVTACTAIVGAVALDSTETVLVIAFAGAALLATRSALITLVPRVRRWGASRRRSGGRHRARGRAVRVVVADYWKLTDGRP